MKKLFTVMMVAAFALSACGKKKEPAAPKPAEGEMAKPAEGEGAKPAEGEKPAEGAPAEAPK
jgi:predicted small lipoprotein YifL